MWRKVHLFRSVLSGLMGALIVLTVIRGAYASEIPIGCTVHHTTLAQSIRDLGISVEVLGSDDANNLIHLARTSRAVKPLLDRLLHRFNSISWDEAIVQRVTHPRKGSVDQVIVPLSPNGEYYLYVRSNRGEQAAFSVLEGGTGQNSELTIYSVIDGVLQPPQSVSLGDAVHPEANVVVSQATDSCSLCHTIYAYIYGVGCTVSATLVCLAFQTPPIIGPVICGAVWAAICVFGEGQSVDIVCETWCG